MAGKAPAYDVYAVIEPENPDNEDAKASWVKMGPLWKTQNPNVLSGHIETVPLEMFRGGKLHIAVQKREEKDDEPEDRGSGNRSNRNRGGRR